MLPLPIRFFSCVVLAFALVVPLCGAESGRGGESVGAVDVPAVDVPAAADVAASVVRIQATVRRPDPYQPWTRAAAEEVGGSGVVIEGRRILTNAHVVSHATQILVQGAEAGTKAAARVVLISPDIDLAVLAVDDTEAEEFFATRPPLPRGEAGLPAPQSEVEVYGFPLGGDALSITRGIVSRVEFTAYSRSVYGLRVQVDAAINPGNSGGPVVVAGRLAGLVFSRYAADAQNIGYVIPLEEIDLFLRHLPGGVYRPKVPLNIEYQSLENPALRAAFGVPAHLRGLLVVGLLPAASPVQALRVGDAITEVEGQKLDNTGMFRDASGHRLLFGALVQRQAERGRVKLTVFRDGQLAEIEAPLVERAPDLLPSLWAGYPAYFIYGPFVFTAAYEEFFHDQENAATPWTLATLRSPLVTRRGEPQAFPGEELVCVAGNLLSHPMTRYHQAMAPMTVRAVDGVEVRNLRHLVECLRDGQGDFVTFTFVDSGQREVMCRAEAERATAEILEEHGIRRRASPDLLRVWEAREAKAEAKEGL